MIQDVVLLGGGHSHAIALRQFGLHPLPKVRLILISEAADTPYSGMLPGHLAGLYRREECHIDLKALAQFAQAELVLDRAIALDLAQRQVICAQGPPLSFDLLSIDIGSTPALPEVPGAAEFSLPVKPWWRFLQHWDQLVAQVQQQPQQPLVLGVVGGGAGGVELALAVQYRLQQLLAQAQQPLTRLQLHLLHQGTEVMTGHNAWVRRRFQQVLQQRGIQLHLGERVMAVRGHQVDCESGLTLTCDRLFWVTQASAPQWLAQAGLATDARGFIQVDTTLRSLSHPLIFAAGDIATIVSQPRPKAGVFAVRQGKPLATNLRRLLLGQPLRPYHPQRHFLSLVSTGNPNAVASWGPWPLGWESPLLWHWKNWIDRRFMAQFQHLPDTAAPTSATSGSRDA